MPESEAARVIIEVTAGVLVGTPEPNYTRRYAITSREWEEAGERAADLLAERNGQAQGYAGYLMLQPNYVNWVRLDWIWT